MIDKICANCKYSHYVRDVLDERVSFGLYSCEKFEGEYIDITPACNDFRLRYKYGRERTL